MFNHKIIRLHSSIIDDRLHNGGEVVCSFCTRHFDVGSVWISSNPDDNMSTLTCSYCNELLKKADEADEADVIALLENLGKGEEVESLLIKLAYAPNGLPSISEAADAYCSVYSATPLESMIVHLSCYAYEQAYYDCVKTHDDNSDLWAKWILANLIQLQNN